MTTSPAGPNTCANCFAEFEWTPFVQAGEDFCCSGCAEGGPCICTYSGASHVTDSGDSGAVIPVPSGSDQPDDSEASTPADSGDGSEEPPGEPPAPGESAPEPPRRNGNGLNVILAAVPEMPLPVQEVVRSRLTSDGSNAQIGEPLGLDADEVAQLLAQGQAILDRLLGPGYMIRYIPGTEASDIALSEQQFPSFDEADDLEEPPEPTGQTAPAEPTETQMVQPEVQPDIEPSDLGQMIARSVDSLTRASVGDSPEEVAARSALAEALREAGNLFRIASERVSAEVPHTESLRSELAEARDGEEPITLNIDNPGDITPFFNALRSAETVRLSRLESLTPERATFRLIITSMMGLVRDLMAFQGRMRPTRLQMGGDVITLELPAEAAPAPEATATPAEAGQARFELSIDSFFGARHFVVSENSQGAPHHHSYRVEAMFVSYEPNKNGFVMGFAQVRELVESTVMNYSETLLNTEDPFREIPPTTENLARVFHEQIGGKLRDLNQPGVRLKHVRVWESPTNSASFSDFGPDAAITA